MYELITRNTNFKKKYLYYATFPNINGNDDPRNWYYQPTWKKKIPTVKKIKIISQCYRIEDDIEYIIIVAPNLPIKINLNDIPCNGTISLMINNHTIISTSKNEIAKFIRKILNYKTLKDSFYDTTSQGAAYQGAIDLLKRL